MTGARIPVETLGPGSYDQETVAWEKGKDLLLLFTDGISDTLAETGRGSGEALVVDTVVARRTKHPRVIVEELFQRAAESDSPRPSDDRTVLVMRV